MRKLILAALIVSSIFSVENFAQVKHTLTLKDAINIALEKNPAVKISLSQVKKADAKIAQAKSYKVPKLDLLTKYFYSNNLPNMYPQALKKVPVMSLTGPIAGDFVPLRPLAPFAGNNGNVFKMDMNLVYPFYTGGKIANGNRSAETLKQLYLKNTEKTKAEIAYKVKIAFYNVLFLKDVISVYNTILDQLNQHFELAKKANEQGVRSYFDVINFESKIEEFKSRIVDLNGKLQVAKTGLKSLLNLDERDSVDCIGALTSFDIPSGISESELNDKVESGNIQLGMLSLKEKLYDFKTKMSQADKMPKLFAFANFHVYHGIDFPPYDDAWRNGWVAGIGMSFNIFNGNLTEAKVQENKAEKETVNEQKNGLKLKLNFQIKASVEKINSCNAQIKALEKTLSVANKGYEIAKVSYENGVITNVQLEDAHLNLLRIRTKILQIKKDILAENAQLQLLKGEIE
jgi:outer membrane protein